MQELVRISVKRSWRSGALEKCLPYFFLFFFDWRYLFLDSDWSVRIDVDRALILNRDFIIIVVLKNVNNLREIRFDVGGLLRWKFLVPRRFWAKLFKGFWYLLRWLFIRPCGWRLMTIRAGVELPLQSINSLIELSKFLIKLKEWWNKAWFIFWRSRWTRYQRRLSIVVFFHKIYRRESIWTLFLIRIVIFFVIGWR